jgi:hypothetical protein
MRYGALAGSSGAFTVNARPCAAAVSAPAQSQIPRPRPSWLASIGFSNEVFERGYVQECELIIAGPVRRTWIMLNATELFPISKMGERVLFVRVIGEYR